MVSLYIISETIINPFAINNNYTGGTYIPLRHELYRHFSTLNDFTFSVPPSRRVKNLTIEQAAVYLVRGWSPFCAINPSLSMQRVESSEGGCSDGRGARTKLPGCMMWIAMGIYMQLCRLRRCVTPAHYTTCLGIAYSLGNQSQGGDPSRIYFLRRAERQVEHVESWCRLL